MNLCMTCVFPRVREAQTKDPTSDADTPAVAKAVPSPLGVVVEAASRPGFHQWLMALPTAEQQRNAASYSALVQAQADYAVVTPRHEMPTTLPSRGPTAVAPLSPRWRLGMGGAADLAWRHGEGQSSPSPLRDFLLTQCVYRGQVPKKGRVWSRVGT